MDNLDEIFEGMPEPDEALDFIIDENKRVIAVPEEGVVLGVEGDKDVNRVRLQMKRYYRGTDFAEFDIRVNYRNANGDENYFAVSEKTVTDETITFIWVVAADAVAYKGTVWFAVNFYRVKTTGEILKQYGTTLGQAQSLAGLNVDADTEAPELVDFMAHLKNDITEHASACKTALDDTVKTAQEYAGNAQKSAANALQSADAAATSAANAAKNEENTRQLLEKVSTDCSAGSLGSYMLTIPADGWTRGEGETSYTYTAAVEKCTSMCLPLAAVIASDIPDAYTAGMYGVCETGDGTLTFWANRRPAKDLTVAVMLLVPDVKLEE